MLTRDKRRKGATAPTADPTPAPADARTGMAVGDLRQAVIDHLRYSVGCLAALARPHDYYEALALAVRDRMQHRWQENLSHIILGI